jgi:hypothetical protein
VVVPPATGERGRTIRLSRRPPYQFPGLQAHSGGGRCGAGSFGHQREHYLATDPLSLNDTLSLLNTLFGLYWGLWGTYFALTFGVLTVATSVKFDERRTRVVMKVVVCLVYAVFAYVNWSGLDKVRDDRVNLAAYARQLVDRPRKEGGADPTDLQQLNFTLPYGKGELAVGHAIADIPVIALIAFAPNAPRKGD